MANSLFLTPKQRDIVKRALEHLKIEYEYAGDPEDKADIKTINSLLKELN